VARRLALAGVASSVRLLMALDQLRPLIEARPAGELA
jgi:hypothetical protein